MAADTRALAASTLARVLAGRSLSQVLPTALEQVDPRDRGLLQQLCYGTLRQYPLLSGLLRQLLDKPVRDREVEALLLLGLYQLRATRVPDHAAVSATVDSTAELGKDRARGLVNAVLRRGQREGEQLYQALGAAARDAHPGWLHRALRSQWPDRAAAIMAANNAQPPMCLRVNVRRGDRDSYLAQLSGSAIPARPGALSPQAIYLEQPRDVLELPGFDAGAVSVQDEAAQLAAGLLDPQPGERVLDACAAPGGKACHILELQPALAELVATDIDAQRLVRVQENLARLGLRATTAVADGGAGLAPGGFDAILLDAPCSATGVIRRHPDVKVLRRGADIAGLAREQGRLLDRLWPLLRPGGRLLYATCSVLQAENSDVVTAFLGRCPTARLDLPNTDWGERTEAGLQLLPTEGGPDGLFYAGLRKDP